MIRIALVGDIGSGKSFYANLFKYPVFNADATVAQIYKTSKPCFNKIQKKLPKFFSKFPIKKKELIQCILANKRNIKTISKIVHPLVKKKMNFFIKRNRGKKIIILDIPLFLENKLNKKNDIIIFIQSSRINIIKRLLKRKNYNKKLINILKKIQWPLKMKKKKSNIIIKNYFERKKAIKDVKNILKEIK